MIRSQERKRKLGRAAGRERERGVRMRGAWGVKEVIEKGGGVEGGGETGEAFAPTFTHFQCNSPGRGVSFSQPNTSFIFGLRV